MSALRTLSLCAAVLGLGTACLEDVDLESHTFPCERPSDCIEGYFCHPADLICVPTGTSTTSGRTSDAGTNRPGLGESCDPSLGCQTGFCVDGYCCDLPCNGTCERCDLSPGVCLPVEDGLDPELECASSVLRCEEFTCGLDGAGACRNCAAGESAGVCNGARACRPSTCPPGAGTIISECPNRGCTRPDACPRGRPIADYNSTSELCERGLSCTLNAGEGGCCSLEGTCCPAPACSELDPACE